MVTQKLERVTRLKDFWVDLNNALIEASCMSAACAASMIERRFDEYCDLWPHIEASIATNLYRRHMISRAFAVRYMLDQANVREQRSESRT
jgi:hypothetical protein